VRERWFYGQWVNLDRLTQTYHAGGTLASLSFDTWFNFSWAPVKDCPQRVSFADSVGNSYDFSFGYYFTFTSKTIVTGVESEGSQVPVSYSLSQNYPNPFNPTTIIKYQIPNSNNVTLKVYDMLGRQVSVLVDGRMEAGVHEVKFDGSGLASGVYFYQLQAADFLATKRLLLIK
jgi:hypothetical protein